MQAGNGRGEFENLLKNPTFKDAFSSAMKDMVETGTFDGDISKKEKHASGVLPVDSDYSPVSITLPPTIATLENMTVHTNGPGGPHDHNKSGRLPGVTGISDPRGVCVTRCLPKDRHRGKFKLVAAKRSAPGDTLVVDNKPWASITRIFGNSIEQRRQRRVQFKQYGGRFKIDAVSGKPMFSHAAVLTVELLLCGMTLSVLTERTGLLQLVGKECALFKEEIARGSIDVVLSELEANAQASTPSREEVSNLIRWCLANGTTVSCGLPNLDAGMVVSATIAYANVSCDPNARVLVTPTGTRMVAIGDIEQGQEITLPLFPHVSQFDVVSRTKAILSRAGFVCRCGVCTTEMALVADFVRSISPPETALGTALGTNPRGGVDHVNTCIAFDNLARVRGGIKLPKVLTSTPGVIPACGAVYDHLEAQHLTKDIVLLEEARSTLELALVHENAEKMASTLKLVLDRVGFLLFFVPNHKQNIHISIRIMWPLMRAICSALVHVSHEDFSMYLNTQNVSCCITNPENKDSRGRHRELVSNADVIMSMLRLMKIHQDPISKARKALGGWKNNPAGPDAQTMQYLSTIIVLNTRYQLDLAVASKFKVDWDSKSRRARELVDAMTAFSTQIFDGVLGAEILVIYATESETVSAAYTMLGHITKKLENLTKTRT